MFNCNSYAFPRFGRQLLLIRYGQLSRKLGDTVVTVRHESIAKWLYTPARGAMLRSKKCSNFLPMSSASGQF